MIKITYKYTVYVVGDNRYVTSTENKTNIAHWEVEKPALMMSREYARDLAMGLTFNGNFSVVVEVPSYVTELMNPYVEVEE